MALIVKDRVLETCSTSGLVDFTLTGAVTGYQRFSAIGNGNTTYYAAYVIGSNDWEVGIGTVGTSSLTRDTILSSSTGSKVNFSGNPVVWCDLPSSKALFTDSNNNATANSFLGGFTSVTASGTQIVLTAASTPDYVVTGSGGQTIKLPDATTLANGYVFSFDNNQSSGAITVNNNSNTLVVSVPSGGYVLLRLLSNSIAAGSWDRHDLAPSNVSWSTNTFDYPGSITSATWNGSTVQVNRGGTGATTLTGYVKGSGTSALTASSTIPTSDLTGTLPIANGGTGLTSTPTNGQIDIGNGSGFTRTTITAGTNILITNSSGGITIATTATAAGVDQTDIGTAPNKIPLNQYLGTMAWQDVVNYKANFVINTDVGYSPNQVPLNQYLGTMAYQDAKFYLTNQTVTNQFSIQPAVTTISAAGSTTLTVAQLLTYIVQVTQTAAVSLVLPTGTLTDAGVLGGGSLVNTSFTWNIINTGTVLGAITLSGGTGHTFVGSNLIAITSSATFKTVKTNTNTFVTYRIT